jgi:transposase-like protein
MNPQEQFCPNSACLDRGKTGKGNIGVHSRKEQRYICRTCGKTFSARKGTMMYRLKKSPELVVAVITLLAYGCPVQAIVAAMAVDERTVRDWLRRAGEHCIGVHAHLVEAAKLNLEQVQADEIKAKTQRGSVWMAMAMMVPTRLWLGGVVSPRRDVKLIQTLMTKVRGIALCRPLVILVDGLPSYVKAARRAFRSPLRTGKIGRPRLIPWPDIAIAQVVKRKSEGLRITRRIVQGCPEMIRHLLGWHTINTAYIERLNATFRQRMACLARRSRALARTAAPLTHGMYLVGCVYNSCTRVHAGVCTYHCSLRCPLYVGRAGRIRWVQRTPAMAAELTDHRWSVGELLAFKVPPSPFVPPKRRGRPPKRVLLEATA